MLAGSLRRPGAVSARADSHHQQHGSQRSLAKAPAAFLRGKRERDAEPSRRGGPPDTLGPACQPRTAAEKARARGGAGPFVPWRGGRERSVRRGRGADWWGRPTADAPDGVRARRGASAGQVVSGVGCFCFCVTLTGVDWSELRATWCGCAGEPTATRRAAGSSPRAVGIWGYVKYKT